MFVLLKYSLYILCYITDNYFIGRMAARHSPPFQLFREAILTFLPYGATRYHIPKP